ncbi:hypothetical protein ACFU3J_05125 [Streptomyces sp. NPDC057411]|uniref:hypothetical protein n=1 Tax=unclassified Streptomyces TaxID=2593676 RepID=UPI00363DC235
MQLLNDPVIRSATIAGVVTYVLACVVSGLGGMRAEVQELEGQLPFESAARALRRSRSEHARVLGTSFGQGATNLALAVTCSVMALSGPIGSLADWLPLLFTDRQRTLDLLADRLASGSLILQITTVAVAVTVVMRHTLLLRTLFRHEGTTVELWKKLRQLNITNAQGGVFLSALTIMWLLRGHGLDGIWMTSLAYVFAFFIDDWIIISEYSIRLDVSSLPFHRWRLRLAYVCLLIPSVVLAWDAFGWWGAGVMVWYAVSLFAVQSPHRRGPDGSRPRPRLPRQREAEAGRPASRPAP